MATYFISDLHLGHKNIIKYDNCPHADIDEYNNDIIAKWNSAVGKYDKVWLLGDLSLSTNRELLSGWIKQLNGIKMMVLGNHDNRKASFYREAGFAECYDHPVILKHFFILSHEPLFITPGMPYYNIFGHVHNHSAFKTETDNTMCVCACRHNWTPIRIPVFDEYEDTYNDTVNDELSENRH